MSGSPVAFPFILANQVEEEVRRIATSSTKDLVLLDHALDRMDQRDISMRQILNVLKNGDRVSDFRWDTQEEKGWKCTFRRVTAGAQVTVAVKLVKREENTCLVVTVY